MQTWIVGEQNRKEFSLGQGRGGGGQEYLINYYSCMGVVIMSILHSRQLHTS